MPQGAGGKNRESGAVARRAQVPSGPATVNGEQTRNEATVSPPTPDGPAKARRMGRRGRAMIREPVDLPSRPVSTLA